MLRSSQSPYAVDVLMVVTCARLPFLFVLLLLENSFSFLFLPSHAGCVPIAGKPTSVFLMTSIETDQPTSFSTPVVSLLLTLLRVLIYVSLFYLVTSVLNITNDPLLILWVIFRIKCLTLAGAAFHCGKCFHYFFVCFHFSLVCSQLLD